MFFFLFILLMWYATLIDFDMLIHPCTLESFHFLNSIFQREVFNSYEIPFISFFLMDLSFYIVYLQNMCLTKGQKDFLL